jgi:hypothetical protein
VFHFGGSIESHSLAAVGIRHLRQQRFKYFGLLQALGSIIFSFPILFEVASELDQPRSVVVLEYMVQVPISE